MNALTVEQMRADIAEMVGDARALDQVAGDLIAVGLDSMKVMRLSARWRTAGVEVKFAELFERPTFHQWCELVQRRQGATAWSAIDFAEIDESAPFALATMQHAYWVGRDENLVLGGVATHFYAELDGACVDPGQLHSAGRALLARHGMLRACMLPDGRQQIMPVSPWAGPAVNDLRQMPAAQAEAKLLEIRDRLSHRRFDVSAGDVFDLGVSLLPDGTTRLHLNIDMLIADALSFRIIINDLAEYYADPAASLPEIGYSYPRYLADRRARPAPGRQEAERYWAGRAPLMPRAPRMPLSVAPEKLAQHRVVRRHHWLSPQEWQVLAARSRDHGVTLSMVFAAAFSEVLGGWSEESSFLLNVPLFDRQPLHPDVALMVGDFSNLLIVGVDTSPGDSSFVDLVRRVQARFTEDVSHSDYSGLEVLRDLAKHDGAAQTLAPVVFTSALGLGELFSSKVSEHFGTLGWNISQAPQVWLDHQVTEHSGGLLLNWDAVEGLFAEGVLDEMFAAYLRMLTWLGSEPDWAQPTPSMLPAEQAARRVELNDTAGPERSQLLHESFFHIATIEPSRAALAFDDTGEVSYADLAGRASGVAGLLEERGCQVGDTVAVTLPKGLGQVEAVLGILHAGAAFVPVGIGQPPARRAAIYADAGVRLVITDAATKAALPWPDSVELLLIDDLSAEPISAAPVTPDDLAYVIYTSGSTGEPKGVRMSHRAAMNTIEDIGDRWEINDRDRGLAVSALDHDWSVYELFAYLSVGGCLVVLDEASRRDAQRWAELVRLRQITVWTSVPALLDMLLTTAKPGQLKSLRLALLGGDWVGLDLFERLTEHAPGCRMVALGGATEVGIHSTWHEVTEVPLHWRSVPYGAPLRNQQVRVVNSRGRDCPDWSPGELWLGGVGVGFGYHRDPQRTEARFVTVGGQRWYRTGDLCRYLPDGTLELLGRTDFQVKILGQRIEIGEVEAALRAHPGVARAVAMVVEEAPRRLAAAVVPAGRSLDPAELAVHMRQLVPEYMVPRQLEQLAALPLNANGKIDRRALSELMAEGFAQEQVEPPRGERETDLAEIWSELLAHPAIGRDDSFFALGGNSLLATRLIAALQQRGYSGASLTHLFASPTLRGFAVRLAKGEVATQTSTVVADPQHRHEPFPATDVQQAYWIGRRRDFALGGVGSHWYWEFDGEVDLARLEEAWNQLVRRHEMLRAVFDDDGRQRILPEVPHVRIEVCEGEGELAGMRERMAHHVFQPGSWPLFDLQAVRHSGGRTRLGVSLDFLALDALSIMIIFSELAALYTEPGTQLPAIEVSFRDVMLAGPADPQRLEEAKQYWLNRVDDLPPAPQLPLAGDTAQISGHRFSRREFRLPAPEWELITKQAATIGVTPSTVVATAFATVLRAWSAAEAFTLNFTVFDRPSVHHDIYKVAGDFTSLLLVADRPAVGESFADAARRLQGQVWADMEHSSFSGIAVMREAARRTGSADVLMPVVFTSTLGLRAATEHRFDLVMPFGEYQTGLSQTPQVWLDHQVTEHEGGLLINWDAADEVFCEGVLDAMFGAYQGLLRQVAATDWNGPIHPAMPEAQRAVRQRVNDTAGAFGGGLLHHGFFAQAQAEPQRVAILSDHGRLTYGELADRALRIAGLLRCKEVYAGDRVAVTLPKGPDQVAAVLGVLAAGGVYVPVGVDQPQLRRERIHASSAVHAVIDEDFLQTLGPPLGRCIDVAPDQPAYVIYTSGSTGEPKGVVVSHASALNTTDDINERFAVGPDDRVLALSSLDFDLSVYDIFGLLAAGGAIVTIAEQERRAPDAWMRLVRKHGVTVWNSVPALLDMLMIEAGGELPPSLRLALVSGDWVGLDLPGRLAAASGGRARLIAMGGATEAAIWSNAIEVAEVPPHWRSVPYGFPLRNQEYRVVDGEGADRPDWVPGELWIGGAGVALGYQSDPARTAARFPMVGGRRWYRTGDLGRYWSDGTLEFLGRADHQVKVGGHRIELGEVEAALAAHPLVAAAAVCVVGDRAKRLAAMAAAEAGVDSEALRAFAAQRLPEYMVPQQLEVVAQLPLTSNGKVDRKAIMTELAGAAAFESAEPPKGATEIGMAELWSEVLGEPVTGRDQSFFALGGDSLLATRLVQLAQQRFGVQISLRDILGAPSVAGQARLIAARLEQLADGFEEGAL